jgi:6-phosphogluconolactonase
VAVTALLLGRGGSTGFPGKNLYPVLGRPLMAYPIMAARESRYVDRIFVSTDSDEIMAVARRYGAEIIVRPPELCTPEALGEDAFAHGQRVIQDRLAGEGETVELMVLLFANAATVTGELIDRGIEMLRADPTLDSAVTVSRYNMWSPPRARKLDVDGCLRPFVPVESFGDPAALTCDRDSQGDVYFADMGVSVVRPRCLENVEEGLLPQRWMGHRIAPIHSWGGCDVDYEWQIPGVEYWLIQHGYTSAENPVDAGHSRHHKERKKEGATIRKEVDGLIVCSNSADLSRRAAAQFVNMARQAVAKQGKFVVCLSGGITPRETYALLAREPLRDEVPWPQVHVFWGDERCISMDHPDNHYRMALDILLSKVPVPAENVHRMRGEATNPLEAAVEYEALLRSFFGLAASNFPRFDLIVLGMGTDAHTASLFPGTSGLHEAERLVVANYVPKLAATRLTFTVPVLNHAHHVMFLVAGEHKAEAVRRVLQADNDEPKLPAQLVRPKKGTVMWLVDEAAASRLGATGFE